jgi:hypothetical protein
MLTLLCRLESIVRASGSLGETVRDRKLLLNLLAAIAAARADYADYAGETFGNGDDDFTG